MQRAGRVSLYFSLWVFMALGCMVLNIFNVDWNDTNIVQGVIVVLVLAVIQGSVLEFPVQTIGTLLMGGDRRQNAVADADHLTLVLNYNVLALSRDDIDECLQTMYEAYMGNLSEKVSAVLVSATSDEALKAYELQTRDNYRALIYDQLFREGLNFATGDLSGVDPLRLQHVWRPYAHVDGDVFARDYLDGVCDEFAREFMVLHRVSRVLRKCGQYQDLMLLGEGDDAAFTYTDPRLYGRSARPYGQKLFHASADVDNCFDRRFDYTLVLDGDTGVVKGSVFQLLQVAAAHPSRGIVQPAIKLHCTDSDTMFMQLESMRQAIYEPITNALTALLGQSSFFGKGLINNRIYIDNVIGTREHLIERVPIDVLSHDTFEAALLQPLYCGSVFLLEAPSYNYVTWNIRERRWNRGEVLLSMYFWKNALGVPMRWIQSKLHGAQFNRTVLRTESKLDFVTSYVAHSALRQMMMKPLLLFYIIVHYRTTLLYRWASIIIIMFLVLVFPKFATCNRSNYKYVLLETVASFLQFTPEALVGCVRIVRAVQANLVVNAKWVPQRAVEEEFKQSNPFMSSLLHLWGYSLFALVAAVLVAFFAQDAWLIAVMLGTLFLLPLYTGFTSLSKDLKSSRALARRREALEAGAVATIAQPDPKSQGAAMIRKTSGLVPAFTNFAFVSEGEGLAVDPSSTHTTAAGGGFGFDGLKMPPHRPNAAAAAAAALVPAFNNLALDGVVGNPSGSDGESVSSLKIPRPSLYPRLELSSAETSGDAESRRDAVVVPPSPNPLPAYASGSTTSPLAYLGDSGAVPTSSAAAGQKPRRSGIDDVPLITCSSAASSVDGHATLSSVSQRSWTTVNLDERPGSSASQIPSYSNVGARNTRHSDVDSNDFREHPYASVNIKGTPYSKVGERARRAFVLAGRTIISVDTDGETASVSAKVGRTLISAATDGQRASVNAQMDSTLDFAEARRRTVLDDDDVAHTGEHTSSPANAQFGRTLDSVDTDGRTEASINVQSAQSKPRHVCHEDGRYRTPPTYYGLGRDVAAANDPTYVNIRVPFASTPSPLAPSAPQGTPDLSAHRIPSLPTAFSKHSFQSETSLLNPVGLLDHTSKC